MALLSSACLKLSVTGLTTQVTAAFWKTEFHKKDLTETQTVRLCSAESLKCKPRAARKNNDFETLSMDDSRRHKRVFWLDCGQYCQPAFALLAASGVFGVPVSFSLGYMVPGTAIGVLVGDLLFFVLAFWLAKKTGNKQVTAMPLGIDTPSLIRHGFSSAWPGVYRWT